jgi:HK97 family phage major capsid protein
MNSKRVNRRVVMNWDGEVLERDSYQSAEPFALCEAADPSATPEVAPEQRANLELVRSLIRGEVADVIEERLAQVSQAPQRRFTQPLTAGAKQVTDGDKPLPRGHSAARCVRYMLRANGDAERAINMAYDCGDERIGDVWAKAMASQVLADGGALIPPEFSAEIIEELGAKAVVRKMGLTVMPMNTGSLTLPYFDTAATASYVGENANITASQPTTAQLQLSDKTLAALCPLSNSLLNNGGPRVDAAIKNHLVRVTRRKEDVTFIRSLGTANEPMGMRYQVLAANVFSANGTINVANVTTDLGKAIDKLMALDVDLDGAGWLISTRTYRYLHQATDANSNRVWRDEMDKGMLEGFPYAYTSQIPDNLGGATNESEIYFVSFPTMVLGENETLSMDVFPGGAYYDGSSVVSGISQNQTVIRLLAHHDLGCQQRGQEIAVIDTVKYGT